MTGGTQGASARQHLLPIPVPPDLLPARPVLAHALQVVTLAELSNLKRQLRAREGAAWRRITWGLARPVELHELEVLQGRLIVRDAKVRWLPWAGRLLALTSQRRLRNVAGACACELASTALVFSCKTCRGVACTVPCVCTACSPCAPRRQLLEACVAHRDLHAGRGQRLCPAHRAHQGAPPV